MEQQQHFLQSPFTYVHVVYLILKIKTLSTEWLNSNVFRWHKLAPLCGDDSQMPHSSSCCWMSASVPITLTGFSSWECSSSRASKRFASKHDSKHLYPTPCCTVDRQMAHYWQSVWGCVVEFWQLVREIKVKQDKRERERIHATTERASEGWFNLETPTHSCSFWYSESTQNIVDTVHFKHTHRLQ